MRWSPSGLPNRSERRPRSELDPKPLYFRRLRPRPSTTDRPFGGVTRQATPRSRERRTSISSKYRRRRLSRSELGAAAGRSIARPDACSPVDGTLVNIGMLLGDGSVGAAAAGAEALVGRRRAPSPIRGGRCPSSDVATEIFLWLTRIPRFAISALSTFRTVCLARHLGASSGCGSPPPRPRLARDDPRRNHPWQRRYREFLGALNWKYAPRDQRRINRGRTGVRGQRQCVLQTVDPRRDVGMQPAAAAHER